MTAPPPPPAPADAGEATDLGPALPCPLCGYDLRGLTAGRCPECGHRFDAASLRWDQRHRHPYLFEHGRGAAPWRFVRTLLAGWRPKLFWRTLRPEMPVAVPRLIAYGVIATLLALSSAAAGFLVSASQQVRVNQTVRTTSAAQFAAASAYDKLWLYDRGRAGSYLAGVNLQYPPPTRAAFWAGFDWRSQATGGLPIAAVALAWPALTAASLLVFRQTLQQANIRRGHVVRVVTYGGDVFAMTLPLLVLLASAAAVGWLPLADWLDAAIFGGVPISYVLAGLDSTLVLVIVPLLAAAAWRLWRAHQLYLRLPHAAATVIASQIIVWLALPALGLPLFRWLNL